MKTFVRFCKRFISLQSNSGTSSKISHGKALNSFFVNHPNILKLKPYIPSKYLSVSKKLPTENLYLICPDTAKQIASLVIPYLDLASDQLIAETNAGLGLITTELLDNGIPLVRLYEQCSEFRIELKNFGSVYPHRIELFTKDLFHLSRYEYIDKQDSLNRVQTLLRGVPVHNWTDEPAMTLIGCMPNLMFLKYLIRSLALQRGPAIYGRIQMFAIMRPRDYEVLSGTPKDNLNKYRNWTILFNLLFNYELLEKFPRKVFLPWDPPGIVKKRKLNWEYDKMYLVRINFKKELPIPFEELLPLLYFVLKFYGRGNNRIVPTLEKWVPDIGYTILTAKPNRDDYFANMNIYTKFRELTPQQILAVFQEMINFPAFSKSPFMEIIESDMLKSETGETALNDANFERNILEDFEEKVDSIQNK